MKTWVLIISLLIALVLTNLNRLPEDYKIPAKYGCLIVDCYEETCL